MLDLIKRTSAFAIVPENAETLVRSDGVKTIVTSLQRVATAKGLPMQVCALSPADCTSLAVCCSLVAVVSTSAVSSPPSALCSDAARCLSLVCRPVLILLVPVCVCRRTS